MISVKESAQFIAENADHVRISNKEVLRFAREFLKHPMTFEDFQNNDLHPKSDSPYAVDLIFVINSLNFCFWNQKQGSISIDGYRGYYALCAALNRAIKEGIEIYDPHSYRDITLNVLKYIFRDDSNRKNCLQLIHERKEILYRNGTQLIRKFNGSFKNCLLQCNNSAIKLLEIILEHFPTFRDEATYKGRKVSFYKRAQILVADLFLLHYPEKIFYDIDQITMFADYRVPQSLHYYGILQYTYELTKFIKNTIITTSHDKEVEIRGCSIYAVELIVQKIHDLDPNTYVNSILVDYMLWNFRRNFSNVINHKKINHHKRITIFY